jgi:DNA-binding CsgD family transcriptional regulator
MAIFDMSNGILSEERYYEIEQSIYEAAVISEKWPAVLQTIGEVGEGLGAVLFSVTEWGSHWTASDDFYPIMKAFIEGWAHRNSRMANGLRKGLHLVPRFVTEADYYDPGEMERDEMHTQFFWPNGIGHSAGTLAALPHGDMICFSVEKARDRGPVSAEALARLDGLRPHLARAAMMTARLGLERLRTAVDTLAQLGFAATAVDQGGKVLVANRAFELESMPWTTRGGDRIALTDRAADQMLRAALDTISGAAGTRSIPLRNGEMPLRHVLHVVPVRRAAHDLFARAAAILVITSTADKSGSPSLLQALFDLTPAEAAVARRISVGHSIDDIALTEGRSTLTLGNQLKSVLAKTGCRRQAELAQLITRLVPPAL